MTRAQGFARGDIDTSFPIDDKFLALRGITDPATYYAASGVYWHIAAAAWREAERKPASRITPDAPEHIALLVRVGLLDGDECVPRRAYTHSVGRAIRARRTATERKSRNRAGMSRGTDGDGRGSHGVSTDIQSGAERSRTERSGTEPFSSEQGGDARAAMTAVIDYIEERTGRPYSFGNGSKVHETLSADVRDFGADPVLTAMRADVTPHPDVGQLVFGASRRLHPINGAEKPGEPDPEYVASQLAAQREERRKARLAGG